MPHELENHNQNGNVTMSQVLSRKKSISFTLNAPFTCICPIVCLIYVYMTEYFLVHKDMIDRYYILFIDSQVNVCTPNNLNRNFAFSPFYDCHSKTVYLYRNMTILHHLDATNCYLSRFLPRSLSVSLSLSRCFPPLLLRLPTPFRHHAALLTNTDS